MEFQVRYLALFFLFLVTDSFESFWMESLKEYEVNAEVPQGSIFGPEFSYYTLMTFLIISFVLLLSMLMISLSTLSVIRHLICDNN